MAQVKFTYALKRFYPDLEETTISGDTVAEIIQALDVSWPKLSGYLVDEQGRLRKHVNIFLNGTMIKDRIELSDQVHDQTEVFIMQALSGG